jgi:hypothetical protein
MIVIRNLHTRGPTDMGWLDSHHTFSFDEYRDPEHMGFDPLSEDEIAHITSVLALLGGRVVHGNGDFNSLAPLLPPPMPDWSPVRSFGGYHSARSGATRRQANSGSASGCEVHPHDHAIAWVDPVPTDDRRSFWGSLGCSCWAF